jgi:hypothetical protein
MLGVVIVGVGTFENWPVGGISAGNVLIGLSNALLNWMELF